jgi:hypothetical protein
LDKNKEQGRETTLDQNKEQGKQKALEKTKQKKDREKTLDKNN